VALSRAVLCPCLARLGGALQTDGDWRGMGSHPPLLTMFVFTVIFGGIAKLPSDGTAPYALMVFAGMLPWTFFSTGLSEGPALWITALNVKYRDFGYVIPFIVQFGLYVSPVGFSSSVIPEQWRLLYSLSPMVGVIDGFRWCILSGQSPLYLPGLAASVCVARFFCGSAYTGSGTWKKALPTSSDFNR
jgi:ABC-type polysaccharide/polyol phosphate export permease